MRSPIILLALAIGLPFSGIAASSPSFSYTYLANGLMHQCQASLIAHDKGVCMAATAAHCLDSAMQQGSTRVEEIGAFRRDVTMTSPAVGSFRAALYADERYYSRYSAQPTVSDVGAFVWYCPNIGNLRVAPLRLEPLPDGTSVWYATTRASVGLYRGTVFSATGYYDRNAQPLSKNFSLVSEDGINSVQDGDSGGGLFLSGKDGEYQLVGILSLYYPPRPVTVYRTGQGLDFFQRALRYVELKGATPGLLRAPTELASYRRSDFKIEKTEVPKSKLLRSPREKWLVRYQEHFFDKNALAAIGILDEALALLPDQAEDDPWDRVFFMSLRAEAKFRTGIIREGLDDLLTARAIIRDNSMVFSAMSAYFLHQLDSNIALNWANRALRAADHDGFSPDLLAASRGLAYVRKAIALVQLQRFAEAAQAAKAARTFLNFRMEPNRYWDPLFAKGFLK